MTFVFNQLSSKLQQGEAEGGGGGTASPEFIFFFVFRANWSVASFVVDYVQTNKSISRQYCMVLEKKNIYIHKYCTTYNFNITELSPLHVYHEIS